MIVVFQKRLHETQGLQFKFHIYIYIYNKILSMLSPCQYYYMEVPTGRNRNVCIKKAWWELHKNSKCSSEQILKAIPYKTAAVRLLTSYLINPQSQTNKVC